MHTPDDITLAARQAAIAMDRVADSFDSLTDLPAPKRTAAAMRAWALLMIEPMQEAGAILYGAIVRGVIKNEQVINAAAIPAGDEAMDPTLLHGIFHRMADLFRQASPDLFPFTTTEKVEGKGFDAIKRRQMHRSDALLCRLWADLFRNEFTISAAAPPTLPEWRGRTQAQLAKDLGVTPGTIHNWAKKAGVPPRESNGDEYNAGECQRIIAWGAEHGTDRTGRECRRIIEGKATR